MKRKKETSRNVRKKDKKKETERKQKMTERKKTQTEIKRKRHREREKLLCRPYPWLLHWMVPQNTMRTQERNGILKTFVHDCN